MKDTRTSSVSWCDGDSNNTLSMCNNVLTLKNRKLTLSYNAGENTLVLFDSLFDWITTHPKSQLNTLFDIVFNEIKDHSSY